MSPVPRPEISATPQGHSLKRVGNTRVNCAMASVRARQATSSDVDSGGALLTSDQSSPTHALAGNPYTVHFLQASKASYRRSQWASCEDYFPRDWSCLSPDAGHVECEPSQYTPRHRPFLEKHGSSRQNRCWLLLRDLSLTVPIQKKDEPSSLTKRRKERD
jgi:hypothetical protein